MNPPPLLWLCLSLFLFWTGLRLWSASRKRALVEPRLSVVFGDEDLKACALDILRDAGIEINQDSFTSEIILAQKDGVFAMANLETQFHLERTEYNLFVSSPKIIRTASQSAASLQNQF